MFSHLHLSGDRHPAISPVTSFSAVQRRLSPRLSLERPRIKTRLRKPAPSPVPTEQQQGNVSGLLEALSFALDLTEGARPGHAVRSCVIGMRLGIAIGLADDLLHDLYYALLLKDVGCSSNAARLCQIVGNDEIEAKQITQSTDWTRFEWKQVKYLLRKAHARKGTTRRLRGLVSMVKSSSSNAEQLIRLRCDKGAKVVRDLGLSQATAGAIHCLDEHWNGLGYPDRLAGSEIPFLARIVSLAQVFETFQSQFGVLSAINVIQQRSGRWFDPTLVRVAVSLARGGHLSTGLSPQDLDHSIAELQPQHRRLLNDAYTVDNICLAFAGVVDAKSPYTFSHSSGVADVSRGIGECMGLSPRQLVTLRRAGLLHDIGKLSVPNSILDKPGHLTLDEWKCVRQHPRFTHEILRRISGFDEIAAIAASHHEKLDGSGYHLGQAREKIPLLTRILTVADMYDALSSDRPYRTSMTHAQALNDLRKQAPHAIDPSCLDALESFAGTRFDPRNN